MTEKAGSDKIKPEVDLVQLKKQFKDTIYGFLDTCIPLGVKENYLYFLSPSSQLYGFDMKKNAFFEPNSSNKYVLINECIDIYFTDSIKKSLEEKTGVKFDELIELLLRFNYREKYIGKKFFFCPSQNTIYVWNMVTSKWEVGEIDKLKYLFSNNDILQDQTKVYKSTKVTSFEDLGIEMEDLEEISERFKDNSIHYFHLKKHKIYSLNYLKNYWYIPEEEIQKKIMMFVNTDTKKNKISIDTDSESESDSDSELKHEKLKSKSKSKSSRAHHEA